MSNNTMIRCFLVWFRGDVKIQVLAIARFLQTLATTDIPTPSQDLQPLASGGNQGSFSRYSSNDILITLTAHELGHMGKWERGLLLLLLMFPYFKSITSIIFGAFFYEIHHSSQKSMKLYLHCTLIRFE